MNRPHTISQIVQTIQKDLQEGPVRTIFDLDSTLYDVSPRISQIINEFGRLPEISSSYPEHADLLQKVTPSPKDWGIKRTLMRYPFTKPDDEFIHQLVHFWKKAFFSSEYLKYDVPYPGALPFVKNLDNLGAEVHYLTGRDVPRMLQGTIDSLCSEGFPLKEDNSNLALKPGTDVTDWQFKNTYFSDLKAEGTTWFFENEPANIHIVLENHPHVKVVFVDTVHSQSAPPLPTDILTIDSFEE